jgi:ankyrin repeat protein
MHSSTHLPASSFIQSFSHASSSVSAATDHASPPVVGEGSATNFIVPVQSNTPLLALPPEIVVYLLKYLGDSAMPLVLSMTCHQLKNIYQDPTVYQPQERELHRFLYTITDPALYAAFNTKLPNEKLNITAPDRDTAEWNQLRNHSLATRLTRKDYQTAFIQKIYITAWEILLQSAYGGNKPRIMKLMQIIGKLSQYISNTEDYAKQLFSHTFPEELLEGLATISIDWTLQLVKQHFADQDSQAFAATVDPALPSLIDNMWCSDDWLFLTSDLTRKPYPSFLHYALEEFYIFGEKFIPEFKHEEIKSIFESLLADPAADFNVKNRRGMTPLMVACKNNQKMLVEQYLQRLPIDINEKSRGKTALDYAIERGALTIIKTLLSHDIALTTRVTAFNYALSLKKEAFAKVLLARAKEGTQIFIDQALVQAITSEQVEVIHQLIKGYKANPNTVDELGSSALKVALRKQNKELLDLLLSYSSLKVEVEKDKQGYNALHYASQLACYPAKQLTRLIKLILAHKVDYNALDSQGNTPLMLACQYKQEEVSLLLLQQPLIDVNVKDTKGRSAVNYAAEKGMFTVLKSLLHHKINVNHCLLIFNAALEHDKADIADLLLKKVKARQDFINQALAQAIMDDSPHAIYKLIKDYAANPNMIDAANYSALTVAMETGHRELYDLLLQHPDFILNIQPDTRGRTILHYISSSKAYADKHLIELVKRFIKQGGSINATDTNGTTPLMLAYQTKRETLVSFLLKQPSLDIDKRNKAGLDALRYAIRYGTVAMVQSLLNDGIAVDNQLAAFVLEARKQEMVEVFRQAAKVPSSFINQALSWAVKQAEVASHHSVNYPFIIDELIEQYGADPDTVEDFYSSVFGWVLREATDGWGRVALLDKLLPHPEVKINLEKDEYGNTPLIYAIKLENDFPGSTAQLGEHLLALGVDYNATDNKGRTALILACSVENEPNLALLTLLLQQPAINVNAQDNTGHSALYYAVRRDNISLVQALLLHEITTKNLMSALNCAFYYNRKTLTLLFQQLVIINVNAQDDTGQSALDYAVRQGNISIVQALLRHEITTENLINAFNCAIRLDQKGILLLLWQKVTVKDTFVNQAFVQAMTREDDKQSEVIYTLLSEYGANPAMVNEYGLLALSIALKERHTRLIDQLLSYPEVKGKEEGQVGNQALIDALNLRNYGWKMRDYPEEKMLQVIHRLFEYGVDCNATDEAGSTALMLVYKNRQEKLAQLLLEQASINLNAKDSQGKSALNYAIEYGTAPQVQTLLDDDLPVENLVAAFIDAIVLKKQAMLDVLWQKVDNKPEFINHVLSSMITHDKKWKSLSSYSFVIRRLIADYGADPNTVDEDGRSILLLVLRENDTLLLDWLLQHPALKINAKMTDKGGETLLHYAVSLQHYPADKHLSLIKRLLAHGVEGNAADEKGRTVLMRLACQPNGEKWLSLLCKYAAINTNATTDQDESALEYAVYYSHAGMVQALLKYGVNRDILLRAFNTALELEKSDMVNLLWPQVQRQKGMSKQALALAIETDQAKAAYKLIKYYEADPETVDRSGASVLNLALRMENVLLLDLLLAYPALKVKLEDAEGNSALMYALSFAPYYAEEKVAQLVKYLLECGADCNVASKKGLTPLIWACLHRPELATLFLQYKADINARDNKDHSALDYAVARGTVHFVQALLTDEVAQDTLLSAFNQALFLRKDDIADVLLQYATRQGNDAFVNQALAWAIDNKQQRTSTLLRQKYDAV